MPNKVKKGIDEFKVAYQSAILAVFLFIGRWMYTAIKPALEAEIAVNQLEDSVVVYSFVNKLIQHDLVMHLYTILILFLLLVCVLRKPIINLFSKKEGEINE